LVWYALQLRIGGWNVGYKAFLGFYKNWVRVLVLLLLFLAKLEVLGIQTGLKLVLVIRLMK